RRQELVLGDRQLQPHQDPLDQRDEEEAERAGDEDPPDVLVVAAGRQLDPARAALGEAVDDELGARGLAHGTSPFAIRPTTRSWAFSMSVFCVSMNSSYSSGETTLTSVRIAA